MASRSFQSFDEYRYGPRSVLLPGDQFRVQGGPVYITDDGRTIPLYDRGVFVFRCYCVRGASRWIEAYRQPGGGIVLLWVGKPCRSPIAPNLRRKPYRVTGKVSDASSAPRKR
jgi:hypothetical protein